MRSTCKSPGSLCDREVVPGYCLTDLKIAKSGAEAKGLALTYRNQLPVQEGRPLQPDLVEIHLQFRVVAPMRSVGFGPIFNSAKTEYVRMIPLCPGL